MATAANPRDLGACIVTGGAQGLGKGFVSHLLAEGWKVGVIDCDEAALSASMEGWSGSYGDRVWSTVGDVRDAQRMREEFQGITERFGGLYALVNNAGILSPGQVTDIDLDEWLRVIDINLNGAFYCAQAASRILVRDEVPGRIINIGSITGKVPRWAEGAYCASKAGLSHLTRVMALELASHGITVNTLSPGSALTGVVITHYGSKEAAEDRVTSGDPEKYRLGIPTGRTVEDEDLSGMLDLLLSTRSAQITGQELFVDGGQSMF